MYSPLRHFGVKAGDRVAILGLGGLGHMGVKLAKAMGAHVTVLSHSPRKKEDARRLGADGFIQQINEAYERTIRSDVRYRFVIDLASLR